MCINVLVHTPLYEINIPDHVIMITCINSLRQVVLYSNSIAKASK